MPIPVVDLFAGPGGLGEGFSSFTAEGHAAPFRIVLSVEKENFAHETLRLRSFVRAATRKGKIPDSYYKYVRADAEQPYTKATADLWEESGEEARCFEIGEEQADKLDTMVSRVIPKGETNWVLIGGPPCQAYSLVGRARNAGNKKYKAEADRRHFLYKHYLRLIRKFRPAVFVMENVKGLLSSKIDNESMFTKILKDLHEPGAEEKGEKRCPKYRIHSVSSEVVFTGGAEIKPKSFLVATENYGVPQKRHRVILLGIREDIDSSHFSILLPQKSQATVRQAIEDLPRLRSGLSKDDSTDRWAIAVAQQAAKASAAVKAHFTRGDEIRKAVVEVFDNLTPVKVPIKGRGGGAVPLSARTRSAWAEGVADPALAVALNHETRNHMADDYARYLFCAAYGDAAKYSPRARHFPEDLAPDHSSWGKGFFDRFRVQLWDEPSTTITSHIHKDGHYYVHPDVTQCRTLTVREAARLQTFPDNYFFEGTRTEQYIQVGNAVPPMLAQKLAGLVWNVLCGSSGKRSPAKPNTSQLQPDRPVPMGADIA